MSEKIPRITAKQIIPVLEKLGFVFSRQSGSHKIYKRFDGRRATVPVHSAKVLHPKILKSIIKDADITVEDLRRFLK